MDSFLLRCETAITGFAASAPGVLALLKTGSRARGEAQSDRYSDLDLLLLTSQKPVELVGLVPQVLGSVLSSGQAYGADEYDMTLVGDDFSRLDLTLVRIGDAASIREAIDPIAANKHLWRGFSVLVDRTPIANHALPPRPVRRVPDAAQLADLASQFWVQALRAAGFILRGDLWRAQTLIMCRLRGMWLKLAEWDAHLAALTDIDSWYDGRHVESWATDEARAALPAFGAAFSKKSLAQTLLALCGSFEQTALRVGRAAGLPPPGNGGINGFVAAQLAELAHGGVLPGHEA